MSSLVFALFHSIGWTVAPLSAFTEKHGRKTHSSLRY